MGTGKIKIRQEIEYNFIITMDTELQKKMERATQAIQIRAALENFTRLPFIPDDIKEKINKELPTVLPVMKDFVKMKLYELSQKLGSGDDRKVYMLKNSASGPTFSIWKNMVVSAGEKEMSFPLKNILDRIEKCDTIETLLAELLSFKLFDVEPEPNQ